MTSARDNLITQCARPQADGSPAIAVAIQSRTYRALMCALEHTSSSPPTAGLYEEFLAASVDTWEELSYRLSPGLGALDDRPGEAALLALLAWLTTCGVAGEWQLELDASRIAFIGGVELRLQGRVRCDSTGRYCRITSCGDSIELHRERAPFMWELNRGKDSLSLPVRPNGIILYPQDHSLHGEGFLKDFSLVSWMGAEDSLAHAFSLIDQASPLLGRWVGQAISGVAWADRPDNMTTSGSSPLYPGLVFISANINVEHLAVLLVHEAAHQYFNLLAYQIDLVSPSSAEKLFSPLKKTERPVSRILLALHACVNILQYTSARATAGECNSVVSREHAETTAAAEAMMVSLSNATTLTSAGHRFLELLR